MNRHINIKQNAKAFKASLVNNELLMSLQLFECKNSSIRPKSYKEPFTTLFLVLVGIY